MGDRMLPELLQSLAMQADAACQMGDERNMRITLSTISDELLRAYAQATQRAGGVWVPREPSDDVLRRIVISMIGYVVSDHPLFLARARAAYLYAVLPTAMLAAADSPADQGCPTIGPEAFGLVARLRDDG